MDSRLSLHTCTLYILTLNKLIHWDRKYLYICCAFPKPRQDLHQHTLFEKKKIHINSTFLCLSKAKTISINLWCFYFCSMSWGDTICLFCCYWWTFWPITVEIFSSFSTIKSVDDIMLDSLLCSFTSISFLTYQYMLIQFRGEKNKVEQSFISWL